MLVPVFWLIYYAPSPFLFFNTHTQSLVYLGTVVNTAEFDKIA